MIIVAPGRPQQRLQPRARRTGAFVCLASRQFAGVVAFDLAWRRAGAGELSVRGAVPAAARSFAE
eukprot:11172841-Lingulodinium_polyedra.AAC.1